VAPVWHRSTSATPQTGEFWEQPALAEVLSNREIDVLVLLAQRLRGKEIAERLVLSRLTVKKHTQRLYRKLGVDNRRAAVVEARRLRLVSASVYSQITSFWVLSSAAALA
jgi:ATP/maltotriose-dependent transcriptional regulator MalT